MLTRLDLAGGDFLDQVVDAGWRQPSEPTNPNPPPRVPNPQPQPKPNDPPPPPPPNDLAPAVVIIDLCEQVEEAAQEMNVRIADLAVGHVRSSVERLPDALMIVASEIQERLRTTAELAAGTVETCEVCGDMLNPEQMAEHRADPPSACLRAAAEKVADARRVLDRFGHVL